MSDQTPPRAPVVVPRGGSMPAGLEEPPRGTYPPNPQHPEIRQTYDPRVSVQLERAARDRASGKPGTAAYEDLAAAPPADLHSGAGPQPLPRAQQQAVEYPPRETPVTFTTQFASYFAGETAAFTPDEAQRLVDLGVTGEGGGGAPATAPPVNVDVPYVSQAGNVLNCTMGNWEGEPTAYAYQWQLDGASIGTNTADYTVTASDVGRTAICVVTATNALGSTAAPPSNSVIVAG